MKNNKKDTEPAPIPRYRRMGGTGKPGTIDMSAQAAVRRFQLARAGEETSLGNAAADVERDPFVWLRSNPKPLSKAGRQMIWLEYRRHTGMPVDLAQRNYRDTQMGREEEIEPLLTDDDKRSIQDYVEYLSAYKAHPSIDHAPQFDSAPAEQQAQLQFRRGEAVRAIFTHLASIDHVAKAIADSGKEPTKLDEARVALEASRAKASGS